MDAIIAAAIRGVKVEMVLPPETQDAACSIDACSNYEAYEYITQEVGKKNLTNNLDLRFEGRNGSVISRNFTKQSHCKYMNVDGVAFFGSMNLDVQSWKYSSEVGVCFDDIDAVKMLDANYFYFLYDQAVPFSQFSQQAADDDILPQEIINKKAP